MINLVPFFPRNSGRRASQGDWPRAGCTTFCCCRPHYFFLYEVRPPM